MDFWSLKQRDIQLLLPVVLVFVLFLANICHSSSVEDEAAAADYHCTFVGGLGRRKFLAPKNLDGLAKKFISDTSDERNIGRVKCLLVLKHQLRDVIGPYLKGKHAILLDQVFHWNLGDSFIEFGEQLLLRDYKSPVKLPCSIVNWYSPCNASVISQEINSDPRDPILLIHGGGNFGDLYNGHRKFINQIVEAFPQVPFLALPQSVYYQEAANAKVDADIREKHSNFDLLARDFKSLHKLRTYFPKQVSRLSVDSAQYIGPVNISHCVPVVDVLFLKRRDKEKSEGRGNVWHLAKQLDSLGITYKITDWFDYKAIMQKFKAVEPEDKVKMPKFRTELGIQILCQGRMVVTDRLHGMIMSTLMGLPHVFLDNTYGKIQSYRAAFFQPIPYCTDENLKAKKAKNWQEAIDIVKQHFGKD